MSFILRNEMAFFYLQEAKAFLEGDISAERENNQKLTVILQSKGMTRLIFLSCRKRWLDWRQLSVSGNLRTQKVDKTLRMRRESAWNSFMRSVCYFKRIV